MKTKRNGWIQLGLVVLVFSVVVRAKAAAFTWDGSRGSDKWNAIQAVVPFVTNGDVPPTSGLHGATIDFLVHLNGNRIVQSATFPGANGYTRCTANQMSAQKRSSIRLEI